MQSNKADVIPEELKSYALERIEESYPENQGLHIYTDSSYLPETNGAGAGWFYRLFEGSLAVRKKATDYDDSQAAILALSSNTPTDFLNTIQCRTKTAELISYGWITALQWIRSHVGIPGNERAFQKAKQEAESIQSEVPLTLRRAKRIISIYIDKYTAMTQKTKSFRTPWETLAPWLATLTAVPLGLGLNPGEDMNVCKSTVPSPHVNTLNSRRAASPLVRLVEGEERWEAHDHPKVFSLKIVVKPS
ncbi:reverse transcriptase [Trichonephila clavipes]|nr:reverse transcriptase [Trichonephila clavipes]